MVLMQKSGAICSDQNLTLIRMITCVQATKSFHQEIQNSEFIPESATSNLRHIQSSSHPTFPKASSVWSLTPPLRSLCLPEVFLVSKSPTPSHMPRISVHWDLHLPLRNSTPRIHNMWLSLSARAVMDNDRFPSLQSQPTNASNHSR